MQKRRRRWISWLALSVVLLFAVTTVEAQRGRRQGGVSRSSGSRNFSQRGPARRGDWQGNRSTRQNKRQENRVDRRDNRQEQRQDNRTERQDNRQERRDDRQEQRQDRREDVRSERREYVENREYWEDYPGLAVAGVLAIGTAIAAAAFREACTEPAIIVNGVSYYRCGDNWYQQAYRGGDVVYIVVSAPQGAAVIVK